MLPSSTLEDILKKHQFCGYGRKRARVFHRAAGSPKRVTALDVFRVLQHKKKKGTLGRQDWDNAIKVICSLLDKTTGQMILRRTKLPSSITYYSNWKIKRMLVDPSKMRGSTLYHYLMWYVPKSRIHEAFKEVLEHRARV